jgi:hypothetical protein
MNRLIVAIVGFGFIGCADQNWAQAGQKGPAPGAPDCTPELCPEEEEEERDDSNDKHGTQGANTLHQATGTQSWFEAVWDCPNASYCAGWTWPQAFPPKEYGSAYYSPSWTMWVQLRPGQLDLGSLPKTGVHVDARSIRFTDGP